ncbi:MAG TPA: endonuclease [Bacteroidetes bacterium]|nr:endonuclease [Bacteroidota bacterium]
MSKYSDIIKDLFLAKYKKGQKRVPFEREDLAITCEKLGYPRIKNLGDIPYSFRFRQKFPQEIIDTAPINSEWIIVGADIAKYEFRLASPAKIEPALNRQKIKIPDSTPEILKMYAPGTDEQALLTRIRYNRLIDIFLGITCYSIQNHFRTTVKGIGQIEVDEIYIGVNKRGAHFVIPCQAKSPGDKFGIAQVLQDIELCNQRYTSAICRPIAIQFTGENDLAILELSVSEKNSVLKLDVVDEKHYSLVPKGGLTANELIIVANKE